MNQPGVVVLAALSCLVLLVTPTNGLQCFKCEDSKDTCAVREKLYPSQQCVNNRDGKCYKVIVDLGAGHRVYHRGCTDANHPDTFCKTEASLMARGGSLEYCGVCSGDECNSGSLLTPFTMLIALLPCSLAYFFSK